MSKNYIQSFILLSFTLLLACGKPNGTPSVPDLKNQPASDEIAWVDESITKQRALIEEARGLQVKAEGGDPVAAKRWRFITSGSSLVDVAGSFLGRAKKSAAVEAKKAQLESIRKEMSRVGWHSIRPVWLSAKLGDADAQNEIYDFFAQENLHYDDRVILKGATIARRRHDFFGKATPADLLPQIEVLSDSCRQASYSYLVDLFWVPPAGMWDALYVEGRYRYDGIEFAPRDWLFKAAVTDSKFKAKLAAVDFVSAKTEAERKVAAKALLSFADVRVGLEGRSLVESCIAAVYCRGIYVQADLSKAAHVMLSSEDNALRARGVRLVCEKNLPIKQEVDLAVSEGEGLLYAVYSKYGYGHWGRDFERAYFEYWLFLQRGGVSSGGDMNFARMELDGLESRLTSEGVLSLQKKCRIWYKKLDGKSPSFDDWVSR